MIIIFKIIPLDKLFFVTNHSLKHKNKPHATLNPDTKITIYFYNINQFANKPLTQII